MKPIALLILVCACLFPASALACGQPASVCATETAGSFPLIENGRPAALLVEPGADSAVRRAADSFAEDLERVSGRTPRRFREARQVRGDVVIVGVIGQSPAIDALVQSGRIDAQDIAGQWEAFRQIVIDRPYPGVERALAIVGADRRGAVYGLYDYSEQIGISPWHWFADVPVERKANLHVVAGGRRDQPLVRYRGFFINDEAPALSTWAQQRFGGANARMYERVFELLLRLKGNYLWPAMWSPRAFYLDDPRSGALAHEMGVVMGTSHHEPMTRAHSEWRRNRDDQSTGGRWDYASNGENLREFWRGGIERMMARDRGGPYENLVTVGMRGDGDEPMAEDTAIDLLESIVTDQRSIIEDVTGRPASETPQVWALYKEVQDYYDRGMTVPDDVTLLFADDNWGQIRRLPAPRAERAGGYGVYYHFDYVGGPRNYKWLNTNQVPKIWQQMNLAYERGARTVWVVNVGDIKPMEYPLDFFMRMAWNPEAMTPVALAAFPQDWARRTFGEELSAEIGGLVTRYSTYAARRKPELIDEDAFPLGDGAGPALDGGEFGAHVGLWRTLVADMEAVRTRIRPNQRDAYFQLVEFPILALANLYELYYATAWNRRLASRHDARANRFLRIVEAAYARDARLTAEYHARNGGKWAGMMSQVHMNYVHWNEPTQQSMPSVTRVGADTPVGGEDPAVEFAPQGAAQPDVTVLQAAAFDRAVNGRDLTWAIIPDLGQSGAAVLALPQGRPPTAIEDGVRLEYDVPITRAGDLRVALHLTPTLNTDGGTGLRIGVSLDDGPVAIMTSSLAPTTGGASDPAQAAWVNAVIDNGHVVETTFARVAAGRYTLKIWRLDDNVVLEHIEIGPGGSS